MKVTVCHIERTYNLGDYNSLKIGFEANLNETDQPLQIAQDLELLINQAFENRHKTEPKEIAKMPAQLANENTTKRATQQDNEDLEYTNENGALIIKPKKFLSKERFIEVNAKVKTDGGEYVKASNNAPGYWKVPA